MLGLGSVGAQLASFRRLLRAPITLALLLKVAPDKKPSDKQGECQAQEIIHCTFSPRIRESPFRNPFSNCGMVVTPGFEILPFQSKRNLALQLTREKRPTLKHTGREKVARAT